MAISNQADRLVQEVGMMEIFTGKAGLSRQCERHRHLPSIRLGLQYGQDFNKAKDRRLLLLLIAWARAKDVWLAWPCKAWCSRSHKNLARVELQERNTACT